MKDKTFWNFCTFNYDFRHNLEHENNFFDIVIIANALHIIPNPKKVIQNTRNKKSH